MEKFLSSDWVKAVFKIADMIKQLDLSLEEIVLIRVILLTYTGIIINAHFIFSMHVRLILFMFMDFSTNLL